MSRASARVLRVGVCLVGVPSSQVEVIFHAWVTASLKINHGEATENAQDS